MGELPSYVAVASLAVGLAAWGAPARAGTVALWLFDEPAEANPGAVLRDAGPGSHALLLGRGAVLVPGRFGNALRIVPSVAAGRGVGADRADISARVALDRPASPRPPGRSGPLTTWDNARFAALLTNGDAHLGWARTPNVTNSKLNLGEHDWTIECWLHLASEAVDEGVIFEVGTGPRGENELLTRFSVLPGENAFALAGISADAGAGGLARRIEFPDPGGPPSGLAWLHTATLALDAGRLPREKWFHVALVHVAETGDLRLWIDGRLRATAALRLCALPRGNEGYVSIGGDGQRGRMLAGAIDELRISDHAVYSSEFPVPASFSGEPRDGGASEPTGGLPEGAIPASTPGFSPPLDRR